MLNTPLDRYIEPGSPEHRTAISASKVAALVGLSPYASYKSLWLEMTGRVEPEDIDSEVLEYGRRREDDIIRFFKDYYAEKPLGPTATYVDPMHSNWIATPDATMGDAVIEAKTARFADEWGPKGSIQVPIHYMIQVMWQMARTGADEAFIVADVMMSYRVYQIKWDDVCDGIPGYKVDRDLPSITEIEDAATRFEADVLFDVEPDWDGSDATYKAARRMHPDIAEGEVTIPRELAVEFAAAKKLKDEGEAAVKKVSSEILACMGGIKNGKLDSGEKVFSLTARGNGTPYITPARNLHTVLGKDN